MTAQVIQLRPYFSQADLAALYQRFPDGEPHKGIHGMFFATGDARGRIVSLEQDRTWVLWCDGTVIKKGCTLAEVVPAA